MSERLEIIKFLRNSEKTVAPGMQPSELISRKDVDWLINRVEELELEENDWRDETIKWSKYFQESEESHLETKELLKNIVNPNKRYREALKNIYELAEYDEYDNTLEQIVSEIEKVLEGDEN